MATQGSQSIENACTAINNVFSMNAHGQIVAECNSQGRDLLYSGKAINGRWGNINMTPRAWLDKHDLIGLGSVEFQIVGISPLLDVLDLCLARRLVRSGNDKVSVIGIFDNDIKW